MTPPLRADAERNRALLLEAARAQRDRRGTVPALAELAACAGLGVGTAYRHFPSHGALVEALALDGLRELLAEGRAAAASDDAAPLDGFLERAVAMLVTDPSLAEVVSRPADASAPALDVLRELQEVLAVLLRRAQVSGRVRADLTAADVQHLVCGVQVAVRLAGSDAAAAAGRYTAVLLAGMRPAGPGRGAPPPEAT